MIGTLIGILFVIIILGVLWWAVNELLPLIPIAEPFRTIARVIMVVPPEPELPESLFAPIKRRDFVPASEL